MGFFDRWISKSGGGDSNPEPAAPGGIQQLRADANVDALLGEEFVLIFKHSTSCPVSWAAHAQVTRFLKENPNAHVKLVRVIQERALSQKIAAATGVRHESPQIIALRAGKVLATASHGSITVARLGKLLENWVTESQSAS
jgi:bacillithiol system protein YtxJ